MLFNSFTTELMERLTLVETTMNITFIVRTLATVARCNRPEMPWVSKQVLLAA